MRALTVFPSSPLCGTIEVPGDKSISHRAIILGSLVQGRTVVQNLLEAEDVLCTINAMRELGVSIRREGKGEWRVFGRGRGRGLKPLKEPRKILYCGNSGTTLRLLTGLLAGEPMTATLTGDASLNARPMSRVMEPLRRMGAIIHEERKGRKRSITVTGGLLRGGLFRLPVASAQLKSALLLAGLVSSQPVTVIEPSRSRDHTERMLCAFGADLRVRGRRVFLRPGGRVRGGLIRVPGDFSSAAFFLVAGLMNQNPKTLIRLRHVGLNPTRSGALEILRKMGGKIRILRERTLSGEPVADLEVQPGRLQGVVVRGPIVPRLIDEIPILCMAAAVAEGKTVIRDAAELRIKETDRIRALGVGLSRFGVRVREFPDGLDIWGNSNLKGGWVRSYGDHRIAMSFAVLGTVSRGLSHIVDTDCIATSFPNFVPLVKRLGGRIFQKTL